MVDFRLEGEGMPATVPRDGTRRAHRVDTRHNPRVSGNGLKVPRGKSDGLWVILDRHGPSPSGWVREPRRGPVRPGGVEPWKLLVILSRRTWIKVRPPNHRIHGVILPALRSSSSTSICSLT